MYIHYLYTFRPNESGFNTFTDGRPATASQAPSEDCSSVHRGNQLWKQRAWTPPVLSSILPSNQMITEKEKESIVSSFAFEKMRLRNLLAVRMDFFFYNPGMLNQCSFNHNMMLLKRETWAMRRTNCRWSLNLQCPSMLTHPSSHPGASFLRGERPASWLEPPCSRGAGIRHSLFPSLPCAPAKLRPRLNGAQLN